MVPRSSLSQVELTITGAITPKPDRGTTSTSPWPTPRSTWRVNARTGIASSPRRNNFWLCIRTQRRVTQPKAEALRYVVHFVGDMHQPLHDADNGDKGGNGRHVIFDSRPDNLHWIWDTGLLEHINRNPEALATELESNVTAQDRQAWDKGSIQDWVFGRAPTGSDGGLWRLGERAAGRPCDRDSVGKGRLQARLPLERALR